MSKSFRREELISTGELKDISQNRLLDEMLHTFKKLGLVHNDELRAVILDIETYEQLLSRLEELEDLKEDMDAAEELKKRAELPMDKWVKKPEQISRLAFFERWIQEKGSHP